jgi:hypothetical protein
MNEIFDIEYVTFSVELAISFFNSELQSADFATTIGYFSMLQANLYTTLINVKTSKINVFVLNRSIFKF